MSIHPTAIVEDGAVLGAGCIIHAHAHVTRHCVLGDGVVVHPFAVIGGDPQDLSFDTKLETFVRVGDRSVLREHVTINRATKAGLATALGADCYLMTASHLAHDCQVGDRVIMANAVLLAGHVHVGERAFLGGGAAIHQFVRIGEGVMLGGLARITRDIPPFTMATERDELVGLNVVGLRRRGLRGPVVAELKAAFRAVCGPVGNPRELAATALAAGGFHGAETRRFLEFFAGGRRGFLRMRGSPDAASDGAGD
jgi:UDP-N-acetylglucosamine acyltransferase